MEGSLDLPYMKSVELLGFIYVYICIYIYIVPQIWEALFNNLLLQKNLSSSPIVHIAVLDSVL